MKLLSTVILVLLTLPVAAQCHWVGAVGGVGRTNVTSRNFTGQTNHQYQGTGGIAYEYFLSEHFSIGVDLLYAPRGFVDSLDGDTPARENVAFQYGYDYLSAPLKVGFNDFKEAAFGFKMVSFAKVGLVPAWLMRAETTLPPLAISGSPLPARTVDVTDRVSPFDLAGFAELGVGGNVAGALWWTISVTYQHSLTSVTNDEYFADTDIWHRSIGLMVGLKHRISDDPDW